ncbi:MAG TPA: Rieske 2Fe-2S domain-containing protein [Pyrinomonadaceae bacterium]|nr:Rieske 2Fe-2S domain-containing protein [Pyrinomonadaceae bacterium]
MDSDKNPTPPAESASDTPPEQEGSTQGKPTADEPRAAAQPSVNELLSAARGDVTKSVDAPTARTRTPVPPSAREASAGTTSETAASGDTPSRKETPAGTPTAARVSPTSGASKTTSTPTPAVNKGVTKAVAAKTPAGTLVQSTPDPPINKLRRRIVWASIASFLGVSFLMFLRFFLPRAIFEPSSIFRVGFPGDYGFGVDTKYQQQYRIWVVKNSERLFVIYARCTHLGCTPDWKESENKFKCPCHGSGYDSEGINFEGPAPRPMDRAAVALDAEGQIVVNVGKLYEWPKGGENHFNDDNAFIRVS